MCRRLICDRPGAIVSTDDVLSALKPLWNDKPETASRLRGRIERVLDAAKAQGLRSGENPARWRGHLDQLLPKRQRLTRGHNAAMSYVDVPSFIGNLHLRNGAAARALEFAILTAALPARRSLRKTPQADGSMGVLLRGPQDQQGHCVQALSTLPNLLVSE
jgi:hypothetical protein